MVVCGVAVALLATGAAGQWGEAAPRAHLPELLVEHCRFAILLALTMPMLRIRDSSQNFERALTGHQCCGCPPSDKVNASLSSPTAVAYTGGANNNNNNNNNNNGGWWGASNNNNNNNGA